MIAAAAIAVAALAVAGCDDTVNLEDQPPPPSRADTTLPNGDAPAPPVRQQSRTEQLIQGWLAALQVGDYERAGSYFARNALVEQTTRTRLRTRADRTGFNRSLPCRAHLVSVRGKGPTVLATFILSTGPGGNCNGSAWVRMRFRDDHITVFHQLPEDPRAGQAPA
jgi:hypothetical protein